jgi:hypothetical protein
MQSGYRVTVVEPARLHLAGHLLAGVLRRSCADPRRARKAARIRGTVAIDAGGMQVCLEFGPQEVRVRAGGCDRPRASIRAPLDALLDTALGRRMVRHFLAGRLRVRGGPLVLARLLGVLGGKGG